MVIGLGPAAVSPRLGIALHCNECSRVHAAFPLRLVAQMVKNPPAVQETRVRSLGQEDPLEKGMAFFK